MHFLKTNIISTTSTLKFASKFHVQNIWYCHSSREMGANVGRAQGGYDNIITLAYSLLNHEKRRDIHIRRKIPIKQLHLESIPFLLKKGTSDKTVASCLVFWREIVIQRERCPEMEVLHMKPKINIINSFW